MAALAAPHSTGQAVTPSLSFMPNMQTAEFSGGTFNNIGRDQHVTVHNNHSNAYHNYYYQNSTLPGPPHPNVSGLLSAAPLDILAILEALPLPNFWKLQADILSKVTDGTGLWLAKGAVLHLWLEKGKILWGVGIPGAGKTCLASIVIHHLLLLAASNQGEQGSAEDAPPGMCVAYVYVRYNEPLPVQRIIESLLKQILVSHPDLQQSNKALQTLYKKHHREGTQPSPSELCSVISSLADSFSSCCVLAIDGVDEMTAEEQRVLLRLLSSIESSRIRVFLTSRPLPSLQRAFPQAMLVDVMAQASDLELHLKEAIQRTPGLDHLFWDEPEFEQEVIDTIKDRCGGMFLHADLQLQALRNALSIHDARETLAQFPEHISDIYLRTWERIQAQPRSHAALAHTVLLWIVNAKREMTIEELRRAVAASMNPKGKVFEKSRMPPEASVTSVCCGLIGVDQRTKIVRLIHFSAKDTLEPLLLKIFPEPQALLVSACLTHLTHTEFSKTSFTSVEDLEVALDDDPLLNYTYGCWDYHAHKCINDLPSAYSQVSSFVLQCESYPINYFGVRFDTFGPLHLAAHMGLTRVFSTLLSTAPDSNIKTPFGPSTPLFLASKRGFGEIIQLLLDHSDTDVNAQNCDNDTALVGACAEDQDVAVRLLLTHPRIDANIPANDGTTAIINAGGRGFDRLVQRLLVHGQTDVNACRHDRWTALMFAACDNRVSTVRLLLRFPDVDPNFALEDGATALLLASINGHADSVEALLEHRDTDPNAKLNDGVTAIIFAAWNFHSPVVSLLAKDPRTDVNAPNEEGFTALIYAARSAGSEGTAVRDLLGRPDIDPNAAANKDGSTPLTTAVVDGVVATVRFLLAHHKTDVNMTGKGGKTALGLAAERNDSAMMNLLLDHPDIDVNGRCVGGDTPLMLACEKNHESVARLLLDRPNIDVNLAANDGSTAIMHAGGRGFTSLVGLILGLHPETKVNASKPDGWSAVIYAACYNHVDALALLLKHPGTDPNLGKTDDEATALLLAAYNGHEECVRLLVQHPEIQVNKATKSGGTPLIAAALTGREGVVKIMLEVEGVDVNVRDNEGASALWYACEKGHLGIVKVLLGYHGIDVDVVGKDGRKVMDLARENKFEEIFEASKVE